jgi:hypothetical protein
MIIRELIIRSMGPEHVVPWLLSQARLAQAADGRWADEDDDERSPTVN